LASDLVADLVAALVPVLVSVFVSVAAATGAISVRAATTTHQLAVRFPLITGQHPPRVRPVTYCIDKIDETLIRRNRGDVETATPAGCPRNRKVSDAPELYGFGARRITKIVRPHARKSLVWVAKNLYQ
jgi:hypothetical protein